jgi:ribonuclease E
MTKKMLINATHPEENRVAIVEDGILTELDIEIAGKEQTKGNIYKASIVRIEPGLQAAFVDYGAERFGFLQMGEIHPSYFPKGENGGENRRPRITDVLRRGQEILVQVVKEERGTKGAALTTFLSLPGRYMVLMPESDTKGVSRKIEDESQRRKLKEAMASLDLPAQMGYIVRTAGIGQKKEELKRDFDYLVRVYQSIQEQSGKTKVPALIYKESNLAIRSLRDYFSSDMDEVLVDDPKVAEEAREFFQQVMPEYARLVKLHQERRPIFSRYQIEEQIDTISKSKVQLPSGGSIVIDPTEALVSIDVNSGKMAGEQGVESTAYKTNLEAAVEIARQLRLRDLGGLIVIDFIDMRDRKHIREIEKCLKDSMRYDKARVTVGRISQFGLLEMSRQRIKAVLAEGSFLPCPHCEGTGKVKSAEAQAIAFLRKVHSIVAKGQIGRVEGEIPLEVATYLLNLKREELVDMERRHQMVLVIKGRPDFTPGQATVSVIKREKDDQIPDQPELTLAAAPILLPAPAKVEEEAPEIELADTEPEETAEGQSPSGEEGKKKRKRRRRKKKPGEPEETQGEEGASEEEISVREEAETAEEEFYPLEAAEAAEVMEEEAAEPGELLETTAAGEEKRKRRRRRRKKKPAAAAEEIAGAIPEAPASGAGEEFAETAQESLPSSSGTGTEVLPAEPGGSREQPPAASPEEAPKAARKRRRPARRKGQEPQAAADRQQEGAAPWETEGPKEQPAPEVAAESQQGAAPQPTFEKAEKPQEQPALEGSTEPRLNAPQEKKRAQEDTGEPASPPEAESAKSPAPARKKRAPRRKTEPEAKTETDK